MEILGKKIGVVDVEFETISEVNMNNNDEVVTAEVISDINFEHNYDISEDEMSSNYVNMLQFIFRVI